MANVETTLNANGLISSDFIRDDIYRHYGTINLHLAIRTLRYHKPEVGTYRHYGTTNLHLAIRTLRYHKPEVGTYRPYGTINLQFGPTEITVP